jgi:hypothetical protein
MLWVARTDGKGRAIRGGILLSLIALNLPHLTEKWQEALDARIMFHQIDDDLVSKLRQRIRRNEVVAFLPWRNDFMANYLAPRAGFRSFNIGGDKNLSEARTQWPPEMLALGWGLDSGKSSAALKLLIDGAADVLVVPYFHMQWSPYLWPCVGDTKAILTEAQVEELRRLPGFVCPSQRRKDLSAFMKALESLPCIQVWEVDLFSTIRLKPEYAGNESRKALLAALPGKEHVSKPQESAKSAVPLRGERIGH